MCESRAVVIWSALNASPRSCILENRILVSSDRIHGSGPKYPIESVDSALRLLKLVAADSPIAVSAAAKALDVAPSTAHRLLAMLQHHGLVEQSASGRTYVLGPWLTDLALETLRDFDIRPIARPHLERLVERVGETAHVTGLHGTDSVFLDCVECASTVRATDRTGQRLPAHASASGKAQLARLPRERVLQLYPGEELAGGTDKSIGTREDLLRELDRVRAAGYAVNRGESEADVNAVAADIHDAGGNLRGAVTVAGPAGRMKPARAREIAAAVVSAAGAIGQSIPAD
jgi:DNA-binding IclR family transcriptional regulator